LSTGGARPSAHGSAHASSHPSSGGRGRLFKILRIAFALGLLVVVAWFVPWRDRLVRTEQGHVQTLPGAIEGNWRDDAIRFHVDRGEAIPEGWPAAVARSVERGESLAVTHAEGFDWRPGMLRVFRGLEPRGLFLAVALIVFGALVAILRWQRLLAVAGCATTYANAFRLSFLGLFFNLIVPGLTGGDVVKAVLVVREHPERRADALMSVIVDRGLGLVVLIGLAACVTLMPSSVLPSVHFKELRLPVLLTFGGVIVGLWLVLHSLPRRILRLDRVIERLPQKERVRKLDRALRIYAHHPFEMAIAVGLSIVNHGSLALGLYELGHAFGDTQLSYLEYLGIASVANTISSVPIAPGGWGVGEAAYGSLFHLMGAPATLGIAVSVTYRLISMGLGLAGGVFLLLPGGKRVRAQIEEEEERDSAA
jgi:uncharacterized protein (TIRG00374 family)